MDAIIDILNGCGYWGMLIAAFLAGSFFPFSSEAVMLGLLATGLDADMLIVYGSIGNVLGSVFNYCVGRMGNLEWIEQYLHVKKEDLDKAQRFMAGRGAWMGFFAFACQRPRDDNQHHHRKGASLRHPDIRSAVDCRLILIL